MPPYVEMTQRYRSVTLGNQVAFYVADEIEADAVWREWVRINPADVTMVIFIEGEEKAVASTTGPSIKARLRRMRETGRE